jgi:hypothetical protein
MQRLYDAIILVLLQLQGGEDVVSLTNYMQLSPS